MNFMKSKSTNSKSKPVNRKISLLQLVGLSIAFFGSIRNVPQVATAGYSAIMWMIISLVIFVVPMAFIAAELVLLVDLKKVDLKSECVKPLGKNEDS